MSSGHSGIKYTGLSELTQKVLIIVANLLCGLLANFTTAEEKVSGSKVLEKSLVNNSAKYILCGRRTSNDERVLAPEND